MGKSGGRYRLTVVGGVTIFRYTYIYIYMIYDMI